jgi:hypothetical protein
MFHVWFGALMLGQAFLAPVPAHVTGDLLFEPGARFQITWGHNCQAIPLDGDVDVWALDGVPDQVVLAPVDPDGNVVTVVATGDDTVQSVLCSALLAPDIQ